MEKYEKPMYEVILLGEDVIRTSDENETEIVTPQSWSE